MVVMVVLVAMVSMVAMVAMVSMVVIVVTGESKKGVESESPEAHKARIRRLPDRISPHVGPSDRILTD